jgi:hypothetical protein
MANHQVDVVATTDVLPKGLMPGNMQGLIGIEA